MTYRLISTAIILFWVIMMGMLVRRTFYSERTVLGVVPYGQVVDKVLRCEDQPSLIVRDTNRRQPNGEAMRVGRWDLRVERVRPVLATKPEMEVNPATVKPEDLQWEVIPIDPQNPAPPPQAYFRLINEMSLDMSIEPPIGLHIRTRGHLTPVLSLISFESQVGIRQRGDTRTIAYDAVRIRGDKASGKIKIETDWPGLPPFPTLPFDKLENPNLSHLLGLGSLPQVAELVGLKSLAQNSQASALPQSTSTCQEELVAFGKGQIRTYVIEHRYGDNFWVKIFVSREGEIWRVLLPLGIEMESEIAPIFQ